MEYLIALVLGTVVAFAGIVLPGLLNMTAVSVSLKSGQRAGLLFGAGMSITTSLQAFAAFGFADYLRRHENVLETLRSFALGLFILLAIVFFIKGRSGKAIQTKTISGRKHFGGGIMMGTLNALAFLYFFAVGTFLVSHNYVQMGIFSVLLFSVGAGIGGFLVFWLYVKAAKWVSVNAVWFTRNMNYIIGGFFLLLACFQGVYMYG